MIFDEVINNSEKDELVSKNVIFKEKENCKCQFRLNGCVSDGHFVSWTRSLLDCSFADVSNQCLTRRQLFGIQFSLKNVKKRIGIKESFDLANLQVFVYRDSAHSKHFYDLTLALISLITSNEFPPMSPGEDDGWWPAHDLQKLPRKSPWKCFSKKIV